MGLFTRRSSLVAVIRAVFLFGLLAFQAFSEKSPNSQVIPPHAPILVMRLSSPSVSFEDTDGRLRLLQRSASHE
jgi:hypothetical protein